MFIVLNNTEVFSVNHLNVSKGLDNLAIICSSNDFKEYVTSKTYHSVQFYINDVRYIGVGEITYSEGNFYVFSGDLDVESLDISEAEHGTSV
jgi:hypothetical protein